MSNPATTAILHNKRLEALKEDQRSSDKAVLSWIHWQVSLPPERKTVVITNDKTIMVATMIGSTEWSCGGKTYTFEEYPKWAEHPNFSKVAKKTTLASQNKIH